MSDDPDVIAYCEAVHKANGKPPNRVPIYKNGWFEFYYGDCVIRARRKQLQVFTKKLLQQAGARSKFGTNASPS